MTHLTLFAAIVAAFVSGFAAARSTSDAAPTPSPRARSLQISSKWKAVWKTDDGRTWCPVPVTQLSWQECRP